MKTGIATFIASFIFTYDVIHLTSQENVIMSPTDLILSTLSNLKVKMLGKKYLKQNLYNMGYISDLCFPFLSTRQH